MDHHLWLIGMMGSGKTATARELGNRWDVPWFDTDAEVASRTGCSIAQLWGERGEAAFRQMESAAVQRVAGGMAAVVATGGGAVLDEENVAAMRASGSVVWLSSSPVVLAARVASGAGRPLLAADASAENLERLLAERRTVYEVASDHVVDTSESDVSRVADTIEAWWRA